MMFFLHQETKDSKDVLKEILGTTQTKIFHDLEHPDIDEVNYAGVLLKFIYNEYDTTFYQRWSTFLIEN